MSLAYILVFTPISFGVIGINLWNDLAPGMVFMLLNLSANFALVASTSSFERYMKFIPLILSLQKLNMVVGVKCWLFQICQSGQSLNSVPYSVTWLHSIGSCKNDPFSINSKLRTMLTQTEQIFLVFILTGTTIWKISNIFGFREVSKYFFWEFYFALGIPLQHHVSCHLILHSM